MAVPLRCILAVAALVALVAGCGRGDDEGATAPLVLDETSFAQVVAAELRKSDLGAEPAARSTVRVEANGNWIHLVLDRPYATYRAEPERREEIVGSVVRDARTRLARGIDGESFAEARGGLRPLLKRRVELAKLADPPVQRRFVKDLVVTYAVERPDEFFLVRPDDVAGWGKTLAEIERVAMRNLARTTEELNCEPVDPKRPKVKLCGWANADGYDATRMLVPELRRDIVREIGPAAYAVPMEHVFVAVPIAYGPRIKPKVLRDFTTAKNPVSPDVFVERGGRLVPLPS